jgi:CRP/FNR family transcriptional regulator, cyclic AMP receptor protein
MRCERIALPAELIPQARAGLGQNPSITQTPGEFKLSALQPPLDSGPASGYDEIARRRYGPGEIVMADVPIQNSEKQYRTTAQVIKGVLDSLAAGREEEAARLYSHCTEDVGYLLMTKAPKDRPLQAKLAKMFFMAKDYEKSALVLESNQEFKRAAELYERTDQNEQAAEMWIKVGDVGRAAQNYEKYQAWSQAAELYTQIQNFERAAYCFEKAVNHFLAGKYYFQIRKFNKSMELLQKVGSTEEHYLDAAVIIGNILAMNGYIDMAVAKYRSVTQAAPIAAGSVSIYYNLAQLYERRGDLAEAQKVYREIGGVKPDYRDVAERLAKLDTEVAQVLEPSESPSLEELDQIEELQEIEEITATPGPHPEAVPRAQIVSVMEGFEFLKNTSLFDRLSLAEMKAMWTICNTRDFQPGEIIIEQDQPGRALFILKKGKVAVQRIEAGKTTELVQLGPGNHVGEMSLVDDANTSARVVAAPEGAQAFEITREKFDELLNSDDKIAIKVFKVFITTFCQRLRHTTAELSALKVAK